MRRRFFCLLLSLLLFSSLFSPASFSEEAAYGERLVEISTAEEWADFALSCAQERYSRGRRFALTADIDLTGRFFESAPYFAGTLDGRGHTISGLSISASGSRIGLFRRIGPEGLVANLSVTGTVLPDGTQEFVGGITGENEGEIRLCSFSGDVKGILGVGGIAGFNARGATIASCTCSGSITAEHCSGGIAGQNEGTITGCENSSGVNTMPVIPTERSASFSLANFDVSSLSQDDFVNLSNFAGIAGENRGSIIGCTNRGAVGSPYTAYNVGGIAGKSSGFVSTCNNSGTIEGRRDVGGIIGQMVPYAVWNFTGADLQTLSDAISYMHYLLGNIIDLTDGSISDIRSQLQAMQGYTWQAMEALASGIGFDGTLDDWDVDITTLTDALNNMAAQSSSLVNSAKGTVEAMATNIGDVARQMGYILNLLFSLINNTGDAVTRNDFSFSEAYDHEEGAADRCTNRGTVRAEANAGGIAGTIGFEIAFDMEDTLNASGTLTTHAEQTLFAAVRACRSDAEIHSREDCAGGIVGRMDIGAVVDCVSSGSSVSQAGDFAGGVAGLAKGTISSCWSRVTLEGRRYVGGIAGLGKDILNCSSWAYISRGTEYLGAVAGWTEGTVNQNRYVEGWPDGVDGVSLMGQTESISSAAFLSSEGIPAGLDTVTVEFVADGKTIERRSVPFGSALQNLPEVQNRGSSVWQWDSSEDSRVYSDVRITGRFLSPDRTIATDEAVPLFLAEGDFTGRQSLIVSPFETTIADGSSVQAYTLCVENYKGDLTIRMRSDGNTEVHLRSEDGWEKIPSRADGQYLVFTIANGSSIASLPSPRSNRLLIVLIISVALVIVILSVIYRRVNRKDGLHKKRSA